VEKHEIIHSFLKLFDGHKVSPFKASSIRPLPLIVLAYSPKLA